MQKGNSPYLYITSTVCPEFSQNTQYLNHFIRISQRWDLTIDQPSATCRRPGDGTWSHINLLHCVSIWFFFHQYTFIWYYHIQLNLKREKIVLSKVVLERHNLWPALWVLSTEEFWQSICMDILGLVGWFIVFNATFGGTKLVLWAQTCPLSNWHKTNYSSS
jgi:hypothetical protein